MKGTKMKVKVKNLEANPYRRIKQYPIDRTKVNSLKTSIEETSFWDNILVRPHPKKKGTYQLAYGHHRFVALKELNIKEVDIPVRKLDDARMVKIMAEENFDEWNPSPQVIIQTVDDVRDFLDTKIALYDTLKAFRAACVGSPILKNLFTDNGNFQQCEKYGIGRDNLVKFLGEKWRKRIEGALRILKSTSFDQKAASQFSDMYNAGEFQKTVEKQNIPKAEQKELARKTAKIVEKKKIGGRDLPKIVEALVDEKLDNEIIDIMDSPEQIKDFQRAVNLGSVPKTKQKKIAKKIVEAKSDCINVFETVLEQANPKTKEKPEDPDVVRAKKLIEDIEKQSSDLSHKIKMLRHCLEKMNATDLSGLNVILAGMSLKMLMDDITTVLRAGQNNDVKYLPETTN